MTTAQIIEYLPEKVQTGIDYYKRNYAERKQKYEEQPDYINRNMLYLARAEAKAYLNCLMDMDVINKAGKARIYRYIKGE